VLLVGRSSHRYAAIAALVAVIAIMIRNGAFVAESPLDSDRHVFVNRAGMRLLFLDAELGQQLQYLVRLDFKLACQLVNSDLQLHK
jgi:hypothetical protein